MVHRGTPPIDSSSAFRLDSVGRVARQDLSVKGPHTESSDLEAVIRYFDETAPADVLETIVWLKSEGWRPIFARGGVKESFGDALVDFNNKGWRIRIVRDRGQWMMEIQKPGWKRPIDSQSIADAIAGKDDWSEPLPDPLPTQIPWEIPWTQSVPSALAWIAANHDAEAILKRMQLKRSRSLFPTAREAKRPARLRKDE
jgi:hypothetical protein